MLRQLARLTRPVRASPGGVALAVYADERGVTLPATDRGNEGVACVDDAARAFLLLCDVDRSGRIPILRAWSAALLEFLLYMQTVDGRFINFITGWSGRRNEGGPTSFAGGSYWHARGVQALAGACETFDDPRVRSGLRKGMAHVRRAAAPANVRALHVLTAVALLRAGTMPELRSDLEAWCAELVAAGRDGVLFDDPDQSAPHLWGHVQEGALAEAGAFLGRPDLIAIARESALRYLAPAIESGFDLPSVQPYGVACAVFGTERLAAATGDRVFARLSELGRAWFHERNPARLAVYDRAAGRVHDGIDGGIVNRHSGAESNVVAGQALLPELAATAPMHRAALERLLADSLPGRALESAVS